MIDAAHRMKVEQAARDVGVEIPRPDERPNWRNSPKYVEIMEGVRRDIIANCRTDSHHESMYASVIKQAASDLRALGWSVEVYERLDGPVTLTCLTVTRP